MKKIVFFFIFLCLTNYIFSQAGHLDTSFNVTDHGYGGEANVTVNTVCLQPDGKILIGGDFTIYNGEIRNRIARLNSDGSLDTTFNPGLGASTAIHSISLQADGRIIIGGNFATYNGVVKSKIARLNADGSLDISFNSGLGFNQSGSNIYTTAIQSDGKIVVGGEFTSFNGTLIRRIARLNSDGTFDSTFNSGGVGAGPSQTNGTTESIFQIVILPDGKILITGGFTTYNGFARSRIARLNTDGTLDTTLNQVTTSNWYIKTAAVLSDEKIVIGGGFASYSGVNRLGIARINADASLDTTFIPGSGITSSLTNDRINSILIQADGKLIIAGSLQMYNGNPISFILRINSNGSFDPTFDTGIGDNQTITKAVQQPDGKIIIVGSFSKYKDMNKFRIARLNPDGSYDTSFNTATGFDGDVWSASIQSDGNIVVGGSFAVCNETPAKNLVRMTPDGNIDATFNVNGAWTNSSIHSTTIQADGKIIIAGDFTMYGLYTRNRIARLNADGTIDNSFSSGLGPNFFISKTYLQPDGKIIIIGPFSTYNNVTRNRIARLNPNGSLDATFDVGIGLNSGASFQAAGLQIDGKIIVVGNFTTFNGTPANRIVRLNADGTLDPTFNTGIGSNAGINSIHLQSDGKILLGGFFTSFNETITNCLIRLNSDGTTDASFYIETETTNYVINNILTQADGKIITSGSLSFPSTNLLVHRIVRLNGDGSLDDAFAIFPGANANTIRTMSFQADGKLIIGGGFTSYGSVGRNRLARVFTATPAGDSSVVNLKLLIQGYYIGDDTMNSVRFNQGVGNNPTDVELISVELRHPATFELIDTVDVVLQTDGTAVCSYPASVNGSFYIAVNGSNFIETWSANPIPVGATPLTYDFTTTSDKAYGNNMIELQSGVFGFYSGDINQDEVIDALDAVDLINDADVSAFGVLATDLNGDGAVDNTDFPLFINNSENSIYCIRP